MRLFITVSILLITLGARGQGFLHARQDRIVDGSGREVLLRGMGLGGWMLQEPYMLGLNGVANNQQEIRKRIAGLIGEERTRHFYQDWLRQFTTKADIDSLAAWGFNSVRLPMHYALYTLHVDEEPVAGQNTWIETGFALTDSLLRWCAANKIYLILDLHAAPGGQGNDLPIADRDSSKPMLWQSEAALAKTAALWKKLAARYANEHWIGGYDLLNEPNVNFTDPKDRHGCNDSLNAPLKAFYERMIREVRSVDRNHLVIIEGNCWGNNYRGVLPIADDNLALSFHRYWNENSDATLAGVQALRKQYGLPLWMGESGENSNAWFRDAVQLLERNGIGWAWWPLKKMGINNPLEIPSNPGYRAAVDWWKGVGPKPDAERAYQGLLQLARDSRAGTARFHPDVVDAMFRQVNDRGVRPFHPYRAGVDSVVWAVHYDMGAPGAAYASHITGNYWVSTGKRTDWNRGWSYRNDAVDIFPEGVAGRYRVEIEPGEWLQYSVRSDRSEAFQLRVPGNADTNAATPLLWVNGTEVPPATRDQKGFVFPPIVLKQGMNQLRVGTAQGVLAFTQLQLKRLRKN